ncbi:recombinase family protein [Nocardia sp. NPDC051756]|uniref:recombinase family protein n=1 Tax=Nocardia sp. NPDC051756 TaxID=3154751 RepID=UPI00342B4D01
MGIAGVLELAVAYLRVSDKKQLNTASDIDPDGNSIATQRSVVDHRAEALPARIIKEFVEPGISAQTVEKRPAFQAMMAYLRDNPQIKYVIVYARSRAFRNYIDAAVTKRQLDLMGVKLISAREDFGDGIYADMMAAITDIWNDTQNKLSGQDISIKMLNKAMNGGTCGRAKLGYVNARVLVEGHQVNTIRVDEGRAPLVVRAWELYATGDYSIEDLEATMADLGLTCRPTGRWPVEKPVSANTLHKMLSDPYYIGYVVWKGETYPGRHEPLIEHELFDRVQDVLRRRSANGNRDRVHDHYLKGFLFCPRCRGREEVSRLVYSESTGRNGTRYPYFICRRSKEGLCDLPALPVEAVEEAVASHYRTLQLPSDFTSSTRALLEEVVADEQTATREMHTNLNRQLKELDQKESRLVDLLADGSMPKAKIRTKLMEIKRQRTRLEAGLVNTSEELSIGTGVLRHALDLIADPYALYRDAGPEVRRRLNETFYRRFYIDDLAGSVVPRVTDDMNPVFADLHKTAHACRSAQSPRSKRARADRNAPKACGLNKAVMVGAEGFEPPTAGV